MLVTEEKNKIAVAATGSIYQRICKALLREIPCTEINLHLYKHLAA